MVVCYICFKRILYREGEDQLKRFSFRYRKAEHKHYVKVPETGCLTLLITGRSNRKWGFWIGETFKRPLKYFDKFGHPPCDDQ